MTRLRILLVDDEQDVIWITQVALQTAGYEVITAQDGHAALDLASRERPDLIVLDRTMPGMDGLQLCREIRRCPQLAHLPLLMLTASHTVSDRVAGLDAGADDYLIKPFPLEEFRARIRALLRRTHGNARLSAPPLNLNADCLQVCLTGRAIQLTQREYQLLSYMVERAGRPSSARRLLEDVWGYRHADESTDTVRWHVRELRKKIETDPQRPALIRYIPRAGYLFTMPGGEPASQP